MRKSLAFFLLILLPVCTVTAAAQNGTVRGKVRTAAGATLTNVIVELWQTGARTTQVVTTNDGDFQFTNVSHANYEIVVNHPGFHPATERVSFTSADSEGRHEIISIEIRLRPLTSAPAAPPGVVFAQEVPFNARLAFETALLRLKTNKPDEAIAKLKEAIGFFPGYFNARFTLASELGKRNQVQPALEELEHARRINDRDPRVYRLFGLLMAGQRKFVVAEFAFREAIARDPAHAQTYHSRAVVLIEMAAAEKDVKQRKQYLDDAERDLNKSLALSEGKIAAAHLQLAKIHDLRGDKRLAIRQLENFLKTQPNAPNAPAVREALAKLRK